MTMIELLLALGLIVLVSGMMFAFYNASLRSRDLGTRRMNNAQLARTIAMKIAEEVRAANGFVPSVGPGISGTDRFISIQTVTIPSRDLFYPQSIKDEPPPAECDIRHVQYYLAYDPDETYEYPDGTDADKPLGLVRREVKTLFQVALPDEDATTAIETGTAGDSEAEGPILLLKNPDAIDLDLLAPEIKYVRFRYFDGVDWIDKWDIGADMEGSLGNSLPQAVEITVGYGELPPPEEEEDDLDEDPDLIPSEPEVYSRESYTVMIRLPQSDTFFGSRMMRAQRRSRRGTGASG